MISRSRFLNAGSFRRRSTASTSASLTVSLRLKPSARATASACAARSSVNRTVRFFAMVAWYQGSGVAAEPPGTSWGWSQSPMARRDPSPRRSSCDATASGRAHVASRGFCSTLGDRRLHRAGQRGERAEPCASCARRRDLVQPAAVVTEDARLPVDRGVQLHPVHPELLHGSPFLTLPHAVEAN